MKYSPTQYAQALSDTIRNSRPEDTEKILDNFAALLRQNADLAKFSEIAAAFEQYEKEMTGVKFAEVSSARKLSASEEKKLIKRLNDYIGVRVELKQKVDEGLIGGVVVRLGDELIDGSIKKNLQELKSKLAE